MIYIFFYGHLTENGEVRLCDFGCAKFIKNDTISTPWVGTLYYKAPELASAKIDHDEKVDIFSAGCVIAELFLLLPLFPAKIEGYQIFEQIERRNRQNLPTKIHNYD